MDERETGLKRYAMIVPLLKEDLEGAEKRRIRNEILEKEEISERTLRRYIAAYKSEGFDGLVPKEKTNKGISQAITADVLDEAIKIKQELPERSIRRVIKILEGEGVIERNEISRSTLSRQLSQLGCSTKDLKNEAQIGRATRRFEKKNRNVLWQSDVKYGPYVKDPADGNKKKRTYLISFIDDATRFVCHSEFYITQKLPILEDSFRKSMLKCGVPDAVYVDNGKIFVSKWFRIACARLSIRHLNAKPYSPESKGKIERFNRTVEEFFQEMSLEKNITLEILNKKYKPWLEEGYTHSEHKSLGNKTPSMVFNSDTRKLKFVTPEACRDAFLWEEQRTVDKTGCFQLHGILYEAGIKYIRKKVNVIYDPFDRQEVEIWFEGIKQKISSPLKIGEYNGRIESLVSEEKTKVSHSRLLKVYEDENKKRQKQSMGGIAFRTIEGGE